MASASVAKRDSSWSSNLQSLSTKGSSKISEVPTLETASSKWGKGGASPRPGTGSAIGFRGMGNFNHGRSSTNIAKTPSGNLDWPVAIETSRSVLTDDRLGTSYTQSTSWRSSSPSVALENSRGTQISVVEQAQRKSPRERWVAKTEMKPNAGSLLTVQTSTKGERSTDRLNEAWEYKIGTVFSAPYHDRAYKTKYDPLDEDMTNTVYGLVTSKYRKFIVVAKFKQHVVALPIFTHNGVGLQNKQEMKEEFISVRESAHKRTAAPAETKHGILWHSVAPELGAQKWHSMRDTCSVQITAPCIHNLRQKCTISGKLDAESTAKLLHLFQDAFGRS